MVSQILNPQWENQRERARDKMNSWYGGSYSSNNIITDQDVDFHLGEAVYPKYIDVKDDLNKNSELEYDPRWDDKTLAKLAAKDAYTHLRNDKIEGFKEQPYCDPVGLSSVGPGANISNRKELDGFTMTPHEGLPGVNNPAYTGEQKDEFHQRHQNFCNSLKIKDKNGLLKFPNMSAEKQKKLYEKKYGEELPHFQEQELDDWGINYVLNQAILPLARKLKNNYGIDYFRDIGKHRRIALADMEYNLGFYRFILDALKIAGHWPGMHGGFLERDWETIAKESHRYQVSDYRNKKIYDYLMRED